MGEVPDRRQLGRLAVAAEQRGFDSIWAGDHVSFHHPLVDVTVALAACSALTERIVLGAGVLLLPLRAPALVAREFSSLDYLSGGRVIIGVGVGGESPKDFEAVGVPVRQRGARTDEAMAVLRELMSGRRVSFTGRFSRFEDVRIEPAPVQPGGPPLWVGGRSEAAIRRAAALGDGWLPLWVSPERLAEGLEEVRRQADGRPVTAAVSLPALVDGSAEEARLYLSRRYATEFSSHAIDRYCLVGPPERCAARAREYVAAGAEHLVFTPAVEPGRIAGQIERLAEVADAAAR
jgi:probable F420-dependent oxidoreductase